MTKSELVWRLTKKFPDHFVGDWEKAVAVILSEMTESLKNGGRIELRGFGSFAVRKRAARVARNPKSGQAVQIGERHLIYFRAGRVLHKRING